MNSILFLTNAYPDFESSYRGIFIRKMATLLKDEGYDISVVTPKIFGRSHYVEEKDGIKVYRFPFFAGDKLLIEYQKIPYWRMILYYITGFFLTTYAMFKNKCNLIHVHWAIPTGLIGVWVAFLLRKPLLITIHGSDFRLAMDQPSLLRKIFLYVCKKGDRLQCVSGEMKKELENMGIKQEKISVFPMGIETDFLNKRTGRNVETFPTTVLSNRNLLPIYNVSLLIRAIPLVVKEESRIRFIIAGDGPEREGLEREVRNLKISDFVQFLGRVPHEGMASLLSQADIYVSTSLHDGTSVSLLEALASGAFPVVTDIPSNRQWISEGRNGFLVPTDQEEILARRIVEAIRDKALVEKSRRENFHLIREKALWSVTMKKTKRIYEDMLVWKN